MSRKEDCPYQRIEYLEVDPKDQNINSGTYIDTGIKYHGGYSVFMAFENLDRSISSLNRALFGASNGADHTQGEFSLFFINEIFQLVYPNSQNSSKAYNVTGDKTPNKIKLFEINSSECNYTDLSSGDTVNINIDLDLSYEGNRNILLFAVNRVNPYFFSSYRLLSFQIKNKTDKTILELIPVRVGDEGFMYDRVSGKLFGNSGTGRFILGPDINS